MLKRFNWGIIGPGRIAHQFAAGLTVLEEAALYAVASRQPERARQFADQYGGAKVYASYEALVADPQVEAVYIATPHRFHYESIRLCLEARKPVLCEKPLVVNAAQARQLIDLARGNKVFLMEALWTRCLPIYQEVRQWLDAQAIGELKLLTSTFGWNVPKDATDRWFNPELAGGTLLDMGVYPIAVSQWVMGQGPQSFQAQAQLSDTGVDVLTAVLLKYPTGVISQFHSSFVTDGVNDFYIYGSNGHIRLHANYWAATTATLVADGQESTVTKPLHASGFEYQIVEAMRCINAGKLESPAMRHVDTLENVELMDNIRAAIGVKYPFESA